jgi:type I restriction enzyme R subunit
LAGFINGLPLVVIELKKPGVPARAAFDENLTSYKHPQNGIPALFVFKALLIAPSGTGQPHRLAHCGLAAVLRVETDRARGGAAARVAGVMIRGTCDKVRLLDLAENFTLFSEHKAGLVKIVGQNHQFLGVNNAIASMLAAREPGHCRGGVFWQTQGSGKSFSMVGATL